MRRLVFVVFVFVFLLACGVTAGSIEPPHKTAETQTSLITPAPPKSKPTNESKSEYPYQTVVTAETLNIRTGAGQTFDILPHVWLMRGEAVVIYQCRNGWGRIGTGRWINTYYTETRCKND